MKTLTFRVEGMHCEGCAETIRTLLAQQPGVQAVAVSFQEGQARVLFDPQAIDETRLTATIQKPGYRMVGRE